MMKSGFTAVKATRHLWVRPSWIAFGLLSAASSAVLAQTVPAAAPPPQTEAEAKAAEEAKKKAQQAAQAAPATDEKKEPMQELVVVGTRASLQSAISRKKNAGTVVDSIVADDIASFPDKNIAEALQRVTGVQLERDAGEGSGVSIRGISPDMNLVQMDGMDVLGSNGDDRSVDFRSMAAELVKSIDVYKGSQASLTEGGLGGTVSITTRQPLELRKPVFSLSASQEYLDTADDSRPRVNFTAGGKLTNGFGALLNVTYDNVLTRVDTVQQTDWGSYSDIDNSTERTWSNQYFTAFDTKASCAGLTAAGTPIPIPSIYSNAERAKQGCEAQWGEYAPGNLGYAITTTDNERTSALLTLQWQINDDLDVYLKGNYNNAVNLQTSTSMNFGVGNGLIDPTSAVLDGKKIIRYTALAAPVPNYGPSSSRIQKDSDMSSYIGGFNWKPSDDVTMTGLVGMSSSNQINSTTTLNLRSLLPGIRISVDPDTGVSRADLPTNFDAFDPVTYADPTQGQLGGPTLQYRPYESNSKGQTGKWDLDWKTDWSIVNQLEFGSSYNRATRISRPGNGYLTPDGYYVPYAAKDIAVTVNPGATIDYLPGVYDYTNSSSPTASVQNATWSLARFQRFLGEAMKVSPGEFYNSDKIGHQYIQDYWYTPDLNPDLLSQYYDMSDFDIGRVRETVGSDGKIYKLISNRLVETNGAFYVQADYGTRLFGMRLTGNVGLRYITTSVTARGQQIITVRVGAGGSGLLTPVVTPIDLNADYSMLLPSFNSNLEIAKNLNMRLGVSKVMTRPSQNQLIKDTACTIDQQEGADLDEFDDNCTSGNPNLKPYQATTYDVDLNWYPNRDSQIGFGVYAKDIKVFIINRAVVNNIDLLGDGNTYNVTMPVNGTGALTYGLEASAQTAFTFLPAPFNGFGGIVNFSYNDATHSGIFHPATGAELSLLKMSKYTYNVILYYDKGWLNTRLAYNYRSSNLFSIINNANNGYAMGQQNRDAQGFLDAKIQIRVPGSGLSFFIEGKNLTGEIDKYYYENDPSMMISQSQTGSRYFAGFSYKF